MGKGCCSVDFSSRVLVAMNPGQLAEARNKVRATLLGRDPKSKLAGRDWKSQKKKALVRTLPKAERQEKLPGLFPPSTF